MPKKIITESRIPKNDYELIDNVHDDVCVWEKLEWSLNVKEFMQLIGYKKGILK